MHTEVAFRAWVRVSSVYKVLFVMLTQYCSGMIPRFGAVPQVMAFGTLAM